MNTRTKEANWRIEETSAPRPPRVPGTPILGSAMHMSKDPIKYVVDCYHAYGPIFQLQLLNRMVTVMAGLEANQFTAQHDEEVFTNVIDFGWVKQQVGPAFTSLPPEEHQYMRRLLRPSYSRSAVQQHIPTLTEVVDAFVDRLRPGDSFEVFPTMQEIVVNQLGRSLLDQSVGEYFEDVRQFMLTMLQVYQFHTKPAWALKLPAFKRAKARSLEMAQRVLQYIRTTHPGDRIETSIDLLMRSTDYRNQPFTDDYFLSEAMGPYLAGQDTVAGTLAFILYTLHKHKDVLARVEPEVRDGFANGIPSANDFRQFDALHKTIVETMRLYPVAVFMPRHTSRTFEFAGYRVDAGIAVYSATTVTHFLPEYYPDPYTFNIERSRGPASTFVPYGVGNYACLGAGIADVQLMVTTAALLRRGHFELDPKDYEAKRSAIPLPNPGRYHLKLVEKYL